MPTVRIAATTATDHELSARRLNIMRCGYAFMGVGLAIVKWPILVQNAPSLPVFEGVVSCLLTAMSLLAFLGLRYPALQLWVGTVGFLADNRRVCRVQCNRTRRR